MRVYLSKRSSFEGYTPFYKMLIYKGALDVEIKLNIDRNIVLEK